MGSGNQIHARYGWAQATISMADEWAQAAESMPDGWAATTSM